MRSRKVLTDDIERKAAQIHSCYIETSARSGMNVESIFHKAMSEIPMETTPEFKPMEKCTFLN